MEGYIKRFLVK